MHPPKIQRFMLSKIWYHSAVHQLEDGKELCCNKGYTATRKGTSPKKGHQNLRLKLICWEKRSHSQSAVHYTLFIWCSQMAGLGSQRRQGFWRRNEVLENTGVPLKSWNFTHKRIWHVSSIDITFRNKIKGWLRVPAPLRLPFWHCSVCEL